MSQQSTVNSQQSIIFPSFSFVYKTQDLMVFIQRPLGLEFLIFLFFSSRLSMLRNGHVGHILYINNLIFKEVLYD
ncbi:hypothetical protein BKK53_00360 [Rodentibacter trehalosifermentans]|nr:hypothetical protein BKK53_00360 [Rodentibacter trehalosifermentans]